MRRRKEWLRFVSVLPFSFLFFFAGPLYLSCDTHTAAYSALVAMWLSVDLGLARPSSLFVPPHCTHTRTHTNCMSSFHANKRQITCIITQPLQRGRSYFIQPLITPCTDCRPPRPPACIFYQPIVRKPTTAAPREAGGRAAVPPSVSPSFSLYLVWFLTPRMRARMASWSPR